MEHPVELEAHEYAQLFPLLVGDEYIALRDDIHANGQHELIRRMAEMAKDETKGLQFDELARLLLDQARIVEGEPIPDPGAFSRRMSTFLAKGLAA